MSLVNGVLWGGMLRLGTLGHRKCALLCGVSLSFLSAVSVVRTAKAEGRVVTVGEITIVGRVQKPVASVDVSRIQPELSLGELEKSFIDKIERAIFEEPF